VSPAGSRRTGAPALGRVLPVLVAVAVGLAACSSGGSTTTTTTELTTTTTVVLPPPRPAVFRAGHVAVRISFPGSPSEQPDPASLVGIFPSGTSVTAWNVGNVGALEVNSFELAITLLPAGVPGAQVDAVMARYFGKPDTTLFGHPALREISTIPNDGTTDYSGIVAVRIGGIAVVAVAYGTTRTEITAFLDSLQLISPKP